MAELERVLYVEDEPDIRAIAQLALEVVGGFTVKVCSSGEQALREVEGFGPDLILLDVMMPGMDGPSTLNALLEKNVLAGIPVVFMTAKVQPGEMEHYRTLGAVDVIPKPFDPMSLPAQIRDIWARNTNRLL